MITRKEYMDGPHMGPEGIENHRAYYAQFITPYLKMVVVQRFGFEKLRKAYIADPYLNGISLHFWDQMEYIAKANCERQLKECGDFWSLAGSVCILKEAARLAIEKDAD